MNIRIIAIAAVASAASISVGATPELRGTWVTTTGLSTGTVQSKAITATNFAKMRAIGLNSVYMDVWRNGSTYYNSDALKAITGQAMSTDLTSGSNPRGDLLQETLTQAHRNGMSEFAWLQYGFATEYAPLPGVPGNALSTYMKTNGWLLKNQAGGFTDASNKYAWMNPLVPQVQQLIINMGVELVTKYDLDGVQFDDRLAWPTGFGYDDYTKAQYFAETGRALPTATSVTDPTVVAFTLWRSQKITAFAKSFSTAIHQANPHALVAAAPGGYADEMTSYAVDTPTWSNSNITVNGVTQPLFDEITPQIYSSTGGSNFTNTLSNDLNALNQSRLSTYGVGLSINGSSGAYDWTTINQKQVDAMRSHTGTKGHIWWYSPGVLDSDSAQLTAYYNVAANGQAERPDRPAGYRPLPIEASAAGTGVWNGTLTESAERYEVIAQSGDTWSIVADNVFPAGTESIATGGSYSHVEFLVDRRGFIAGDANFDNKVDFSDLVLLALNYNAAGKLWTQGDFNLDGSVDFNDLVVLAQNWGVGVTGSLMSFEDALALVPAFLPEPTTATGLGAMMLLSWRRSPRRNRKPC